MSLLRIGILVLFFILLIYGMTMFINVFGYIGLVALALICFILLTFVWIYRKEVGHANSTK